ncbi:hypothetical protein Mgra_00001042 [Meloidogyne graminicola]|uniref:Uncharacterized protein n=1 Tax=Meloidogyne graminicola TaxID=189291 RepID=A0A8T0A058_9BILA|nr:hypothetical protein Mgra_00001042 [Meloidogyne graminicola]
MKTFLSKVRPTTNVTIPNSPTTITTTTLITPSTPIAIALTGTTEAWIYF